MTIRHAYQAVANDRRTRLGAGWAPSHHDEPREYHLVDGPVANARRARAKDDVAPAGATAA
ncbi:hypothetical protein O7606_00950 [Micromonospora sp. WMMD882]|uniref:hypothetical protein n=1 Tax=Micromonospora sp. WMMD882 TaxID=3015151 RepID=UPI00248C28CD|nr:hypothetical protein [Micromonospora sp. WMMD882]WBB80007.1 hypothetical protein O7606_00950 [Micromonospora sp. WMMD882]